MLRSTVCSACLQKPYMPTWDAYSAQALIHGGKHQQSHELQEGDVPEEKGRFPKAAELVLGLERSQDLQKKLSREELPRARVLPVGGREAFEAQMMYHVTSFRVSLLT